MWSSFSVVVIERSTSEASKAPELAGQYCCKARATGLMRAAGMTLPGNGSRMKPPPGAGRVVSGS
jgi:hypothetical protein